MSTFTIRAVLGLDGRGFEVGMTRAEVMAKRFANRLAGFFTLGAATAATRRIIQYASSLNDAAERTGVSVENLQKLNYALRQNGAELDDIISFWDRLNKARESALRNPEGPQAGAFAKFDIGSQDLANKGAEELTKQIVLKISTSKNAEELAAALMAIGGRGVNKLVATFRQGLDQMYQDINVMTSEQAMILDELGDVWDTFFQQFAAALAPTMAIFAESLNPIGKWFTLFIKAGQDLFDLIIGFFQDLLSPHSANNALDNFNDNLQRSREELLKTKKQWEETWAANAASRRARIASRGQRGPLTFEPLAAPETATKQGKLYSDALLAVGNFLGAGRDSMRILSQQQVNYLRQIEVNTRPKISPYGSEFDEQ